MEEYDVYADRAFFLFGAFLSAGRVFWVPDGDTNKQIGDTGRIYPKQSMNKVSMIRGTSKDGNLTITKVRVDR